LIDETHRPRRHGVLMTVLLVLALALTLGAATAIWLDRQALSNRGWTDTSADLLENPQIRTAVADQIVDQLFAQGNVNHELSSALGPLAPPAGHQLRSLGTRLAVITLQTKPVQRAWRIANSQAHRQLVADIEHNRDRDVYLQLTPIVNRVLDAWRASKPIQGLPSVVRHLLDIRVGDAGRIRVLRADQVRNVRVAANAIRNLVLVLSLLAGICFVVAIAVATERRLRAIAYVGVCLAIAGGLLLAARALIGPALADALVPASAPANRAAVRATWLIGSTQLRDAAIILLIVGGVLLIGGAGAAIESARRGPSAPVWQ
jgi:hypothetical protein